MLGHRLLHNKLDNLTTDQLNIILNSYGHYKTNIPKYLENACVLQINILNGNVSTLELTNENDELFNHMTDHDHIKDTNVLAKHFVDGHPKYKKKNQTIKKMAYKRTVQKINSKQFKNLLTLYELTNKNTYLVVMYHTIKMDRQSERVKVSIK
ncbi:hypothetical protein QTP88_010115 [Uroleucon formosanum]